MHGYRPVLFAAFVVLNLGCYAFSAKQLSATRSLLRGSNSEVRDRLLKSISVGTSHADAELLLKSLGPELRFEPSLSSASPPMIHCRYTGDKRLFSYTVWLIQIDCPDGYVADILCEQIAVEYGLFD